MVLPDTGVDVELVEVIEPLALRAAASEDEDGTAKHHHSVVRTGARGYPATY